MDLIFQRLQAAVAAVRLRGLFILRGWSVCFDRSVGWDPVGPGVDPIGALLLCEQPVPEGPLITDHGEAARLLQVGVPWIFTFRAGFYCWTECAIDRYPPYRLGAWFACAYAADLEDPLRLE